MGSKEMPKVGGRYVIRVEREGLRPFIEVTVLRLEYERGQRLVHYQERDSDKFLCATMGDFQQAVSGGPL